MGLNRDPQGAEPSSACLSVPCNSPLWLQALWGFLLAGSPGVQLVSPDTEAPTGPPIGIQGQQWIQQCSLSKYQCIRDTEGDQVLWAEEMRGGLEHGLAALLERAGACRGEPGSSLTQERGRRCGEMSQGQRHVVAAPMGLLCY